MLEFIISPNLLLAGKPAIWYLSAYDARRRRNISRAVDNPSCRGNLCGCVGRTYIINYEFYAVIRFIFTTKLPIRFDPKLPIFVNIYLHSSKEL